MAYFKNIHSLAELKKEYRRLALENHPDKGGSTEVMQQINVEFERLHEIWKDDTTVSANASGYENDYAGASAKEYTDFVYNEYRWKGRNYQGQHTPEIVELVRNWMKETYPKYKFSVSRHHYNSIHIYLVKADFEAFKKDKGVVFHHDVNHYHIDNDDTLTDRAKEVMKNVCDFVMSYNFDDSDPMTDYFCTNFYLTLGVGTYKKPYKVELPKLDCKGKKPDVFKHPEGAAHKAIRQALGGAYFSFHNSQRLQGKMILGEDSYGHSGDKYFWPLSYSSAKTAQKRMDKADCVNVVDIPDDSEQSNDGIHSTESDNATSIDGINASDVTSSFDRLKVIYKKVGNNESQAFGVWQQLSESERTAAFAHTQRLQGDLSLRSYLYVYLRDKEWMKAM